MMGIKFTEKELIMQLDCERDYLMALLSEGRSIKLRALSQARIDAYRRRLADRDFS